MAIFLSINSRHCHQLTLPPSASYLALVCEHTHTQRRSFGPQVTFSRNKSLRVTICVRGLRTDLKLDSDLDNWSSPRTRYTVYYDSYQQCSSPTTHSPTFAQPAEGLSQLSASETSLSTVLHNHLNDVDVLSWVGTPTLLSTRD